MASQSAWECSFSNLEYAPARSANQPSSLNDTGGRATFATTQGCDASNPITMEGVTSEVFQRAGRSRHPSGGPNHPQGNSNRSPRSSGVMVTRDQVLTKSTDQGATSLAVKILTRVDPGIMASAGRRYSPSDVGELQVTGRSPVFGRGDSCPNPDDPDVTLEGYRGVGIFGSGTAAVRGVGEATFGRRREDRDLDMAARMGSLSELRLVSVAAVGSGEAAVFEPLRAIGSTFGVLNESTFARLDVWDGAREACRRGCLPVTEASGRPLWRVPVSGPDTCAVSATWGRLVSPSAPPSTGSVRKSEWRSSATRRESRLCRNSTWRLQWSVSAISCRNFPSRRDTSARESPSSRSKRSQRSDQ